MISVYHSGRLGDIIYSLKAVQKIAERHDKDQIRYIVHGKQFYEPIASLLAIQPRIAEVKLFESESDSDYHDLGVDYNLDNFRGVNPWTNHLILCHLRAMNFTEDGWKDPWLTVNESKNPAGKPFVLIQRTWRYRNPAMNWKNFVQSMRLKYGSEVYFVGLEAEWKNFGIVTGEKVEYLKTKDMLELAEYIKDADMVATNQSSSIPICQGIGKDFWMEATGMHSQTLYLNNGTEHFLV